MGQTVNLLVVTFGGSNPSPPTKFCGNADASQMQSSLFELLKRSSVSQHFQGNAAIAQLVEHDLAKVGVASSSLVCRSHINHGALVQSG